MKKILKIVVLTCFCALICVAAAFLDTDGSTIFGSVSARRLGASSEQITLIDADGNSNKVFGVCEFDSQECPVSYVDAEGRRTVITYFD